VSQTVVRLLFSRARQGQRGRVRAIAAAMRSRMVAIESGMWRRVRMGRTPGSVTKGNGRFFEAPDGSGSRGVNGLPFGDEEAVSRDSKHCVMMGASPPAAFVMSEAKFPPEFLPGAGGRLFLAKESRCWKHRWRVLPASEA
jgi:hypothetical protein